MPSAYHVHPEFGYFCPTPYRRRVLLVAVVSILLGAMIGGSIATLRAANRNPDGASTASHVDFSNSERVPVAAAEATPAAPNDADTKVEAKESIKPFPIRRVRVRPAVHNPINPAVDPTVARSGLPPRSRSGKGSHTFKAVAAMMRELITHGTTIVRTTGLVAPMWMLTICAPDNSCSEGNSYQWASR